MGCTQSVSAKQPRFSQSGLEYQTSDDDNVKVFNVPVYRPTDNKQDRPLGLGMKVASFSTLTGVRISHIVDGGAAQNVGLQQGDVITEIDGRNVLNASHDIVLQQLQTTNESVTITIIPPGHASLVEPTFYSKDEIGRMSKPTRKKTARLTSHERTQSASVLLSTRLHRPETSGWLLKKEGFLMKSKRATNFKKTTTKRYFVLKVEPYSRAAELEYFDGLTFKGSMTLQGAKLKPGLGGSFTLHAMDRTWYLKPVDLDISISFEWMEALQSAIEKKAQPKKSTATTLPRQAIATERQLTQAIPEKWTAANGPRFYAKPEGPVIPDVSANNTNTDFATTTTYPNTNLKRLELRDEERPWTVDLDLYTPPTWNNINIDVNSNINSNVNNKTNSNNNNNNNNITNININNTIDIVGDDNQGTNKIDSGYDEGPTDVIFNMPNMRGVDRRSRMGIYSVDALTDLPYNPAGRTGMCGRGDLPRFGPNHFGGLLLGRNTPDGTVEFLVFDNDGVLSIPLAFRRPVEHVLSTTGRLLEHHFLDNPTTTTSSSSSSSNNNSNSNSNNNNNNSNSSSSSTTTSNNNNNNSTSNSNSNSTTSSSSNSNSNSNSTNTEEWVRKCLLQGVECYAGYLSDSRNTDNAWAEMTCFTVFDTSGELFKNCTFKPEARWIEYFPSTFTNTSHQPIIEAAVALHAPIVRRRTSSAFAKSPKPRLSSMRYPSEDDLPELIRQETRRLSQAVTTTSKRTSEVIGLTNDNFNTSPHETPTSPTPTTTTMTMTTTTRKTKQPDTTTAANNITNINNNNNNNNINNSNNNHDDNNNNYYTATSHTTTTNNSNNNDDNNNNYHDGNNNDNNNNHDGNNNNRNNNNNNNRSSSSNNNGTATTTNNNITTITTNNANNNTTVIDTVTNTSNNINTTSTTFTTTATTTSNTSNNNPTSSNNITTTTTTKSRSSDDAARRSFLITALSNQSDSRLRQRCMELISIVKTFAPELATAEQDHELFVVIQDYTATDADEFSVSEGDELLVHRQDDDGWWLASRIIDGKVGYLPSTFLKHIAGVLKDRDLGVIVNRVDYTKVPEFQKIRA